MKEAYRELMEKLTESDRYMITGIFFDTARDIIVDNAPKELTENELKRYVYEKMYKEPAPPGVWE
jgi:hypothetical protein